MDNITVNELFDYLLKDAKQHRLNLLRAAELGDIPPSLLNSEILAKYHGITDADEEDTDLDYIDELLLNPQENNVDLDKWYTDAVAQELQDMPQSAVQQVTDSLKGDADYANIYSVLPKEAKVDMRNKLEGARVWRDALIQDRMLNNIRKNPELSDDEKIEQALRLVFNYNTRQYGAYPEDWKMSQWNVFNSLLLSENPEQLDKYDRENIVENPRTGKLKDISDPSMFSKERMVADAMPLTYSSDKHDEYGQLFTPSEETNAIYNIFVDKLVNDLKQGTTPDVTQLAKYINDAYQDSIKTMTYDDWEKEIAKTATGIDVDRVLKAVMKQPNNPENVINNPYAEPIMDTGTVLGDDIARILRSKRLQMERDYGYKPREVEKVLDEKTLNNHGTLSGHINPDVMRGMIEALMVSNSDKTVEEERPNALTPEDWISKMPDSFVLRNKSQEELADSKLNRFHGDNKLNYNQYLKYKEKEAKYKDKGNSEEYNQYLLEHGQEPTEDIKGVVKNFKWGASQDSLKEKIVQFLKDDMPRLEVEFNDAYDRGALEVARNLAQKIEYREALINGGETDLSNDTHINADTELDNWATRIMSSRSRDKKYGIPDPKKVKGAKYEDIVSEYKGLRDAKDVPHLSWEKDLFDRVNYLLNRREEYEQEMKGTSDTEQKKTAPKRKEKKFSAEQDDIAAIEAQLGTEDKKKTKPKEDYEMDLVEMEEKNGYR